MGTTRPTYKVFFVETPSPEENCFVIAINKASAAKFERDSSGGHDCDALFVRNLTDDWAEKYLSKYSGSNIPKAWYLYEDFYEELGIFHTMLEGDDVFIHGDNISRKQGEVQRSGFVLLAVKSEHSQT
jgi:hypothetical protein